MGHKAKWEYFRAVSERYCQAGREAKPVMLDEFCVNTGYNRKYAIRLLNGPPPGKHAERRSRGGRPRYGPQVLSVLADAQQLFLHPRAYPVTLADPGHPARQQGRQPHRPGISGGFPDRRG